MLVILTAATALATACDDSGDPPDDLDDSVDDGDDTSADLTDSDASDADAVDTELTGDDASDADGVDPCPNAACSLEGVTCQGDVLTICAPDARGCLAETTIDCTGGGAGFCDDTGATPMCGTDVCFGKALCDTAGTTCNGDTLVTCMADIDGCLVEVQTDCAQAGGTCDASQATPMCSVDPCDGVDIPCATPGTSCSGDVLTTCAQDANGCLVETTTDCSDGAGGFCDSSAPAACGTDPCFGITDCTAPGSTCTGDVLETCAPDANGCLVTSAVDCAAYLTTCDASGAVPVCADTGCVDTFSGAVEGAPALSGDTTGAGDELTASCSDVPGGGQELVYAWIAPQAGCFELDLDPSGASGLTDPLLYVLDGCTDPTELACNDDVNAGDTTSRVRLQATADTPYLIVADGGEATSVGTFEVDIQRVADTCTETSCGDGIDDDADGLTDCLDLDCAVLDACIGSCATGDLGSATGTPVITASTVSQRDDLQVGASCSYERTSSGEDVVFRWIAPQTGCVAIDTENSTGLTDSLLYVFDDCLTRNSSARVDLACDENGATSPPLNSSLRLETTAGQELLIAVDAWDSSVPSGEFDLNIEYLTGPCFEAVCADGTDDDADGLTDCADPDCGAEPACVTACVDAAHQLGSATGDEVATGALPATPGEDFAACGGDGAEIPMAWQAAASGCYVFDTEGSTFDTVLELRSRCTGASLICDDDSGSGALSSLRHEVALGEQVVVWLDAPAGASGDYQLNIERVSASCLETACADGTDDDDDGLLDCADPDCDGSQACRFLCVDAADQLGAVTGTPVATGTLLATFGTDRPACGDATDGDGAEVALGWSAPSAGCYVFDTEGSAYDTTLELRASCTGAGLACDDASGTGDLSSLRYEASAGEELVVWLDAQRGQRGDYQLNIEQVASCTESACFDGLDDDVDGRIDCADPDCAAEPLCTETSCGDGLDDDGDGLTDCLDVDCAPLAVCQGACPTSDLGSATGTPVLVVSNAGQGDDFLGSCAASSPGGADVSLTWMAPSDGCYEIDTFGSVMENPQLVVFDDCVNPTELACNNDVHRRAGIKDARLRLEASEGASYLIVADAGSAPNRVGELALNIEHVGGVCFETACSDGSDDDEDSLIDCADPDCFGVAGACDVELDCADLWDNDSDGDLDCADPDCVADPACAPVPGAHEAFEPGEAFDLAMRTVTYTPDATQSSYAVTTAPATALPTTPGTGTVQSQVLAISDNGSQGVALSGGATVSFFGLEYVDFHVGANGGVTFGVGDGNGAASVASFYALPRIAASHDHLLPADGAGGTITVDQFADRAVVSFVDVPVWSVSPPFETVTFQIAMHLNTGLIEVIYLTVGGQDPWVGISSGLPGSVYPAERDFYFTP